ncbi:PREDICTED: uncharacterized protein LOC18612775 [Theobroma cacao]|uniref:Uncharacterized protein LOC18612775 n=1 Tax=Theobroma cacao TaxID=3641 RepID=A0AB32VQ98_THECC|nr:PREDICTED: uncharacterized protein LOC18612775 [Theobroma cacao]
MNTGGRDGDDGVRGERGRGSGRDAGRRGRGSGRDGGRRGRGDGGGRGNEPDEASSSQAATQNPSLVGQEQSLPSHSLHGPDQPARPSVSPRNQTFHQQQTSGQQAPQDSEHQRLAGHTNLCRNNLHNEARNFRPSASFPVRVVRPQRHDIALQLRKRNVVVGSQQTRKSGSFGIAREKPATTSQLGPSFPHRKRSATDILLADRILAAFLSLPVQAWLPDGVAQPQRQDALERSERNVAVGSQQTPRFGSSGIATSQPGPSIPRRQRSATAPNSGSFAGAVSLQGMGGSMTQTQGDPVGSFHQKEEKPFPDSEPNSYAKSVKKRKKSTESTDGSDEQEAPSASDITIREQQPSSSGRPTEAHQGNPDDSDESLDTDLG